MKHFCIVVVLCAFSLAVQAQDQKTFDQMTLVELQSVDIGALDKASGNAYKKALKKAEKDAKARQKAEEKKRKAAEKAMRKKMKAVDNAYANTRVVHDEFAADIQVLGPKAFIYDSFADGVEGKSGSYAFISLINPQTREHTLQLFIHTAQTEYEINFARLEFLGISLEEHAERKGIWSHYDSAVLKGGVRRNILPAQMYADPCNDIVCYFKEDFSVFLTDEDLMAALHAKEELAIKISGGRGESIILRIPLDYLVGYSLKLAEINLSLRELADLAHQGREHIKNSY